MSGKSPLEKAVMNLDVKAALRIIKKLIKKEGWKSVLSQVRKHLNKAVGKAWYARNWFFLSLFDLLGLIGIDTDVEKILVRLDDEFDYSTIQAKAAEKLIIAVRKQLRNGGPTLFFDIKAMMSERSAVLIEDLVRARQKEFVHWCENYRQHIHTGTRVHIQALEYMHHGLLLEYAKWLNDDGAYHEPGSIRWELGSGAVDDEDIDVILQEFGEDNVAELLNEPYTHSMSKRMSAIIDALFATPDGEFWWSPWESTGEEILKPLIYSGILDAVQVLKDGQNPWRGVPTSLKDFFQTFSTYGTHPFATVFLLELNHPKVPIILPDILKGENALSNGPTHIINNLSDKQIEENLGTLIEFFVNSEWGDSGEYGPTVPESVQAASRAIEKKAHLIPKEQRVRMKEISSFWLNKWYTEGSVYEVNEIVLRTQGPDAIEFAKEAIISHFDWETIAENYFIDTGMANFLESKKIDPISVLVDLARKDLYYEDGWRYMKLVSNYSVKAAEIVRSELINADLTNIFHEDRNKFFKELSDLLGAWAPYAYLGELVLKNCNFEALATIDPTSCDWNLVSSYEGFFEGDDWDKRVVRDVVHILTTPFKQTEVPKELTLALDHNHVKPRTGAAFLIWVYGIESTEIKDMLGKLSKKYKDEAIIDLALKRMKNVGR
jgi:hypothetical protein